MKGGCQVRLTKIKIKNLFGIKEFEADGKSLELSGLNGAGKTSVIDAIRYALTNKSDREYIVRKGETEGEILIETDNNMRINRKARTTQADYKSVKKDGYEVGSPESFLRDIFSPLQLSPFEFMSMDKKQQNAIILDMVEYPWTVQTIKEWFGEIPSWVSYDQNILSVLNDIQSEKGEYFQQRHDIALEKRNKRAFIEEIAATIPTGYQAERWEKADLSELYQRIERIRKDNETIQKAKSLVNERNNKVRAYDAEREIALAALERECMRQESDLKEKIASLEEQINSCRKELSGLSSKKQSKTDLVEEKYRADIATYDAVVDEYRLCAEKEPQETSGLMEEAAYVEEMKKHLNEHRRMLNMQEKVDELIEEERMLTEKIEKARALPGEILQTAKIPIEGLTVKDGIPLIRGLPISNLSDGEKLDLCIDVAIQKPNGLQIILIDGVEKLSTKLRTELYQKCKDKGLQFIATRTTDDDDLLVVEL